MKHCRKCNIELTDDNWYLSYRIAHKNVCRTCVSIYNKQYRQDNKEMISQWYQKNKGRVLEQQKLYYQANKTSILKKQAIYEEREYVKEKRRQYQKIHKKEAVIRIIRYQKKHREKVYDYMHKWMKTSKGRQCIKRRKSKRRELGFNPLNDFFEGCVPNHINKNDVIYIPNEINKIIYHDNFSGKNMDIINTYAYFFLVEQNIDKLSQIFSSDK